MADVLIVMALLGAAFAGARLAGLRFPIPVVPEAPAASPPGTEAPRDTPCAEARGKGLEAALPDAPAPHAEKMRLGVVHEVPTEVSEFVIPDFRPGLDLCRVRLSYPDIDFVHWREDTSVKLAFFDGQERLTVVFAGLEAPPMADVAVDFEHPRRGPQSCLLSELVDVAETELPCAAPEAQGAGTSGLTEFSGFDADAECIEIFMPGAADPSGLNIAVRPSEDGRDAMVLIDGHPTAILRGAPRATSRNVRLVTVAGVWAA